MGLESSMEEVGMSGLDFGAEARGGAATKGFDAETFRRAMGSFATGVTVVGVAEGEGEHGMTANAFMSGSAEPPLCLVSVNKRARTHALLMKAELYGVSVLAEPQVALAKHFSGKPGKDADFPFARLAGAPVLAGGCAQIAARIEAKLDCGDHTLFVGRIMALEVFERPPLVYHRGAFRNLSGRVSAAPQPECW